MEEHKSLGVKIKELKKADESHLYFLSDHEDPLLEYVNIIAQKYRPTTILDLETGYDMPAQGNFIIRYFDNAIKVPEEALQQYLDNKEIQETVKTLGYDIEKLWYLILFIYDFSYGYCFEGFNQNKTSREEILEFINRIVNNVESYNEKTATIDFKQEMKVSLEIKGKKFIINDSDTVFFLGWMALQQIDKLKQGTYIDRSKTTLKHENNKFIYDTLTQSVHIWYFAKMFLTFFKLKPPLRKRAPKGSTVSLDKRLLISNLVYIIFDKEAFCESTDYLNELFQRFKNKKINRINGIYL